MRWVHSVVTVMFVVPSVKCCAGTNLVTMAITMRYITCWLLRSLASWPSWAYLKPKERELTRVRVGCGVGLFCTDWYWVLRVLTVAIASWTKNLFVCKFFMRYSLHFIWGRQKPWCECERLYVSKKGGGRNVSSEKGVPGAYAQNLQRPHLTIECWSG